MSIFTENQEPMFASKEHYEFFKQTCERLNADCYLKALIYTVGISEDTRSRWSSFYDEKERTIKPEVINSGWQTSGSVRITRLAFQLFTDSTPTAIEYDKDDVPFPVSWTVKMKKKQKETQDILSYHTQAAGCSDKARAKASGGRQPIEECGRTGL